MPAISGGFENSIRATAFGPACKTAGHSQLSAPELTEACPLHRWLESSQSRLHTTEPQACHRQEAGNSMVKYGLMDTPQS